MRADLAATVEAWGTVVALAMGCVGSGMLCYALGYRRATKAFEDAQEAAKPPLPPGGKVAPERGITLHTIRISR